ncbi:MULTISPECIES: cytochrome aa3 quinol oxidase subunit II [Paenibacillus]|uniref:Quinol oxidase subunit 2 n=1 Tax=Paenibacillus macerans TaxID=44252 RepID=A0A090ZMK3_PAEMA|nr:cytochrome aa3 quinol oxidase subunit II [Paenibacillus macerans]KFN11628.1 cytochrome aa3 quinol oxidase, subunit II [Paenibacillus macerans]MBS5913730.1 cytochrome aa3 quinol oxidase subunit II [Paenibacillus macerans]MCY7562428.1 cytochrome aa3 quinol oxidase subunit II [Paenibacillus macerans]MEC0154106.1 cytochrome aa3 quinol oxidase subunit II [Paenibacillus macerans]MUG26274.1 cytochrome aa3 quinol oxidase subunit II [Paenibacillus macerans]
MKRKGLLLVVFSALLALLTGCDSLTVLNPKGPVAKTQSDVIIFSIITMAFILLVVYVLYIYMLSKYRASKLPADYEPPHEEGSKWLEITWITIPIIIVAVLSVVTVRSTAAVEKVPAGYEDQKPLVIYAASSNWKWHFSYPEEGIETVNYVNIPTHRPVEFRLYSYGPITSFWVPQLGGQKYAMSDMVNKLNLVAEHEGSYMGKNSNFSGEGFAHMEFEALAMSPSEYDKWVEEVKTTAPALTEQEFDSLLNTEFVGRKSYSSTHLSFKPAPEGENAGHHHGGSEEGATGSEEMDHSGMDMPGMDMSDMNDSSMDHSTHN